MHIGRIDRNTAAARVYRVLRNRPNRWIGGWDLSQEARTDAVGTRVSEVRRQLPDNQTIECELRTENGERRFYYRLVVSDTAAA